MSTASVLYNGVLRRWVVGSIMLRTLLWPRQHFKGGERSNGDQKCKSVLMTLHFKCDFLGKEYEQQEAGQSHLIEDKLEAVCIDDVGVLENDWDKMTGGDIGSQREQSYGQRNKRRKLRNTCRDCSNKFQLARIFPIIRRMRNEYVSILACYAGPRAIFNDNSIYVCQILWMLQSEQTNMGQAFRESKHDIFQRKGSRGRCHGMMTTKFSEERVKIIQNRW